MSRGSPEFASVIGVYPTGLPILSVSLWGIETVMRDLRPGQAELAPECSGWVGSGTGAPASSLP